MAKMQLKRCNVISKNVKSRTVFVIEKKRKKEIFEHCLEWRVRYSVDFITACTVVQAVV